MAFNRNGGRKEGKPVTDKNSNPREIGDFHAQGGKISHHVNTKRGRKLKKNDQIVRQTDSVSPDPAVLTRNRKFFGLTQAQAAALIHVSTVTWQQYEQGKRSMHPAFAELFMLKAAQLDR